MSIAVDEHALRAAVGTSAGMHAVLDVVIEGHKHAARGDRQGVRARQGQARRDPRRLPGDQAHRADRVERHRDPRGHAGRREPERRPARRRHPRGDGERPADRHPRAHRAAGRGSRRGRRAARGRPPGARQRHHPRRSRRRSSAPCSHPASPKSSAKRARRRRRPSPRSWASARPSPRSRRSRPAAELAVSACVAALAAGRSCSSSASATPAAEYAATRHNAGYLVVDELARRHGFSRAKRGYSGRYAAGLIGGRPVGLLIPTTYMNDSGRSVAAALRDLRLGQRELLGGARPHRPALRASASHPGRRPRRPQRHPQHLRARRPRLRPRAHGRGPAGAAPTPTSSPATCSAVSTSRAPRSTTSCGAPPTRSSCGRPRASRRP